MTHQRNDTPEPLAGNLSPADVFLLGRAALAAGYIEFTYSSGVGPRARNRAGLGSPWNPLDDEADAEALRVKLGLKTGKITKLGSGPAPSGMHAAILRGNIAHTWSAYLTDAGVTGLASARRRAIVNAAADAKLKGGA